MPGSVADPVNALSEAQHILGRHGPASCNSSSPYLGPPVQPAFHEELSWEVMYEYLRDQQPEGPPNQPAASFTGPTQSQFHVAYIFSGAESRQANEGINELEEALTKFRLTSDQSILGQTSARRLTRTLSSSDDRHTTDVTQYELVDEPDDSDYETLSLVSKAPTLSVRDSTVTLHDEKKETESRSALEVIEEAKELKVTNRHVKVLVRAGKYNKHSPAYGEESAETRHHVRIRFGDLAQRLKKKKRDTYDEYPWSIDSCLLEITTEKLGTGSFASVYKGVLRERSQQKSSSENEYFPKRAREIVALKIPHTGLLPNWREIVSKELRAMEEIGRHLNIVGLFGITSLSPKASSVPVVVLEHCENGDLLSYLRKSSTDASSMKPLPLCQRTSIALQICDAMVFISTKGFVHRELAAQNVFLTSLLVPKIGDFGSARSLSGGSYLEGHARMALARWTAPEAILNGLFSVKSDVWSFAVLLFEIFSNGATPYEDMTDADLMQNLSTSRRLELEQPTDCPTLMYETMRYCWNMRPEERPMFQRIRECIQQCVAYVANDNGNTSYPTIFEIDWHGTPK